MYRTLIKKKQAKKKNIRKSVGVTLKNYCSITVRTLKSATQEKQNSSNKVWPKKLLILQVLSSLQFDNTCKRALNHTPNTLDFVQRKHNGHAE